MSRLKSDFLSRASHDLRTPLTSIRWSIDNLLDGAVGEVPPAQLEYLRAIRGSADYLGRLVANLLEVSRLEQNPDRLDVAPVRLGSILERAIATMRPMAEDRTIEMSLSRGTDLPILGNEEKIEEIAVNLLDNAIKFSPSDARVDVVVENGDETFGAFSVRDRGPGFGSDRPDEMFGRFTQGTAGTGTVTKGFGLGLYIVKEYMTLMQGTVEVDDHPDGGAVVRCWFRRRPAAKEPAHEGIGTGRR
jgi:signal transduction histidine kinase